MIDCCLGSFAHVFVHCICTASKQVSLLSAQRVTLDGAACAAAASVEDAQKVLSGLDEADERLGETLAGQGRSLAVQREDVEAQRQQLQALAEAQQQWWGGLTDAASQGRSRILEIIGAVQKKFDGLVGSALPLESAAPDVRTSLAGYNAVKEALVATLREYTSEMQVWLLCSIYCWEYPDKSGANCAVDDCSTASRTTEAGERVGSTPRTDEGYFRLPSGPPESRRSQRHSAF